MSQYDNVNAFIEFLKSISDESRYVNGYSRMRNKYGRPFRKFIKDNGGYKEYFQEKINSI